MRIYSVTFSWDVEWTRMDGFPSVSLPASTVFRPWHRTLTWLYRSGVCLPPSLSLSLAHSIVTVFSLFFYTHQTKSLDFVFCEVICKYRELTVFSLPLKVHEQIFYFKISVTSSKLEFWILILIGFERKWNIGDVSWEFESSRERGPHQMAPTGVSGAEYLL